MQINLIAYYLETVSYLHTVVIQVVNDNKTSEDETFREKAVN